MWGDRDWLVRDGLEWSPTLLPLRLVWIYVLTQWTTTRIPCHNVTRSKSTQIPKAISPTSHRNIGLAGSGTATPGTEMNVGQHGRCCGGEYFPVFYSTFGDSHYHGLTIHFGFHLISTGQVGGSFYADVIVRDGLWGLSQTNRPATSNKS